MMKNNTVKKIGRRAAGAWGRCGSKKLKRAAAKAARKFSKAEICNENEENTQK